MEYFRVPAFSEQSGWMADPGGIVCLCGKALDLMLAWQRKAAGADSQCIHCQRCYDSRGKLISALRATPLSPLPRAPQLSCGFAQMGLRSSTLWGDEEMPLAAPKLAPASMPIAHTQSAAMPAAASHGLVTLA